MKKLFWIRIIFAHGRKYGEGKKEKKKLPTVQWQLPLVFQLNFFPVFPQLNRVRVCGESLVCNLVTDLGGLTLYSWIVEEWRSASYFLLEL